MTAPWRLMCVLAHPDDESLAVGGILAKYAAEGVATSLIVATRGERGWHGDSAVDPGPAALGRLRERELSAAARILGIGEEAFLGYCDGDLDRADPAVAIGQIVAHVRRIRPQVVVTFGPDGAYGHPDHIAISQLTTAAVIGAADPSFEPQAGAPPHRVAKLYYRIWARAETDAFRQVFGTTVMEIDGIARQDMSWPDWAVTAQVDTAPWWRQVRDAVICHRTQIADPDALCRLSPEVHRALWGCQTFYRAASGVNGGRAIEDDLFAGLR